MFNLIELIICVETIAVLELKRMSSNFKMKLLKN